ncbi:basic amino acid/polyamine antiporter [Lacipirellula parvula]|uniref:Arginine/ornithine antiporter ArcD n=1 Tax=Lacipirellula parvula TaxID=2650471 RepID=A0A5K7XKZ9_9BACT|nr:basic amino acid/polyamine antiporter [Lacipirellula parvula]BBO35093.1 arginine/ornithine antiporter ArcD [Lacipirellula parvula]
MSESSEKKFSLPILTAMVVGSMVGSGIFMLPRRFGEATGVAGALIAWVIAGTGMFMLARVVQTLAVRKPELDAGVYAYAKEGFGDYAGFLSALGYWAGTCIGNVSYFVLIMSTFGLIKYTLVGRTYVIVGDRYSLGGQLELFGAGDTVAAVVFSSIILWAVHFMVLRGVKQAAAINTIATVAKIIPIVLFLVFVAFGFKADLFTASFWGGQEASVASIYGQVRATMAVTLFVFLGVEGASVYSRYAKRREDVGAATIMGFLGVLCLMVLITLLSYGALARPDLAGMRQPSMAGVLEAVVGPWGALFISIGLIISVLGAFLSWTLLAAEVLWTAAKTKDMPTFFARENRNGAPAAALWLTNAMVQVFLIATLFSADALRLMVDLTGAMSLIPYLLMALFGLMLAWHGQSNGEAAAQQRGELVRAAVATVYTAFLIYALGMKFLLLSAIIYAPGTLLYIWARREQQRRIFSSSEWVVFLVATVGAAVGIYGLATGSIAI